MIWGSGGSKSRLAKAAGAEPAGQMRDEKLHAVAARSTFRSQNVQNTRVRTTFGSWDVEKVHAVVVRSTFRSQNVQHTPFSDHFWKLRCRKSARRCGAKHISKSKCTKHTRSGPLLEVEMLKKCTPLWREAHFQVKMYKTHHVRRCTDHFWRFRCRKSARRCGAKHISKSKCTKHTMYGPLLEAQMSLRFASGHYATLYTPLHYTTVHYTILHSTTLQLQLPNYTATLHHTPPHSTTLKYTTLHHITLHSTTLHYITLHYTTFHYTSLHYTPLHSTTLQLRLHNYTPLHSITLNYITLHNSTLHYTTFHYTPLHSTTLHYTTWHWMTLHLR